MTFAPSGNSMTRSTSSTANLASVDAKSSLRCAPGGTSTTMIEPAAGRWIDVATASLAGASAPASPFPSCDGCGGSPDFVPFDVVSATSITVTPEQVGDTQSCHTSGKLWTHFVNYDLAARRRPATKIRDRSSRWLF